MDKGEKILENLPKYKLYEILNKKCEDKNIYVSYCSKVDYLEEWYSGFLEVCYMFARNLINLHEILSEETDKDKHCRYINFWITDYVRKKLETQWQDIRLIDSILPGFLTVEHSITAAYKNNNCYFDYISEVDINLWKERKDLFDYIENYNYIKEKIKSDEHLCKIYSKYFAYIKGLHDKYKSECCNDSSDKCPHQIDLSYFCTSDTLSNELECDKTKGITTVSPGDEESQPMVGLQEGDRSSLLSTSSLEHNHDANRDEITNNTDYYSKLGVGFSFLGILSSFFYIYKFTTFGNWIRSKVLKNEMKVKLDEYAQNLTTHELNNFDENNFTDGYNITYHPS
ncbi:PIR Superfamily Protein [Plasmodium ovale curtisi]|uniref:PIR Superfamily Protein n=1 Tax=Plasmodium ovale curtisi TaxID=864141 RepID=A0A1A8X468_PLAOA|nr:PIR Superfamily Protein [Plasmodium ovale curtisi]